MTEIEELEDEMMSLKQIIDENNLLSEGFLTNNVFPACENAFSKY